MQAIGRILRISIQGLLTLLLILAIAGCQGLFTVSTISQNDPLPVVAPLPNPQLPDWIEQISPTGEANSLAQIRIRFKDALIPVESLDSPDQQQLLRHFELLPPLPGQFRFLTPRMVGFQADEALPKATRFQVTLKSGLADLNQHRLAQDLAWTFNTEPIKLTDLTGGEAQPGSEVEPIGLKPALQMTANVELDLASVQEHARLLQAGDKTKGVLLKVAVKEEAASSDRSPEEKFDPATRAWVYTLTPQQNLEKATKYRLEFSPGLRPRRGNLTSTTPFVSQLTTYSPLTFNKIQFYGQPDAGGAYGRFVKGSAQLQFNNGLTAASVLENIKVSPAPKETPQLVQAYDGEKLVNLNPWSLEPSTTYTITLGANLKDQFGQTLGKPITLKYETGDAAPDIWAPDGLHIFPSGKNLDLNISTINLPEARYKAAYRVVQPTDLVYYDSAYPQDEGSRLLPDPAAWTTVRVACQKKNQSKTTNVALKDKLGAATGMLAYGIQARTNRYSEDRQQKWREPTTYGLVQLTNLGVFAQWFPESGLIRVHHLSDGSAVKAAAVEVYQSKLNAKSRPDPEPCAVGQTDKAGTLLLKRQELQSCMNGKQSFSEGPQLLVIAREKQDWAFSRSSEYSGAYGYGVDAGWQSGQPESRGVVFSDRQLYQPGEKAWLTGAAYYLQNGSLKQDKNVSYTVTLQGPDGQKTNLGTQTTNEFGTFSLEVPLKGNQPLGYYSIQAKGEGGAEITGEFRVAEFKPPNFKVDLSLDKTFALIDQKVAAKAQSNYLFGPPVQGGQAQYYVTREQTQFTPTGWQQFSFGRQWFWPEESPAISSDVLQQAEVLNDAGQANQTITIAKDLPYPMTYRVDVQISDVSNLSVSDSQTFTALPSDRLIGLQSEFVADATKAFPVQVIVTDPNGKVLEGQQVRLELQQMKYSSVTRVIEGSQDAQNQVEYKTVAQTQIRSGATPQAASLTPPESGSYRIRANFVDAKNELTATDLQVWATGASSVSWGSRYTNDRLEVKLDKDSYQPGETATALIQSPYPEAELYFAVVRHNTLYQQVIPVKGGAPQVQFQVTPDMLPNAAVEAVLVRQGPPLDQVEPGSLENLVKIGFAPFQINLDQRYLKVQVTPGQSELQPGADQTVQLDLKDTQGQPVSGQVTLMVVNEAVLQLSGYRPPDLVKTVYAEQPISMRWADNRPDVVLEPLASPLQKGWGYGGGQSAGAASTRVRKDFQALAYYKGSILTGPDGKAQATFKLPDDLTTWRVMAVATSNDMRFGDGEATFITTKPLLSNPILPQFARPGDRLLAGLSVTNTTGQSGTLAVKGELNGPLQFEQNNQPQQTQTLQTQAEPGTHAYRFPMVVPATGTAQVRFTTELNSGMADAFEVPLEIKPLEITEQVVETGTTTQQAKIPLNVDKRVVPEAGGLEIALASSLIPEITAPARQVLDEQQLPFLEPAASQLAIATNLFSLSQKYGQTFANFNPTQKANQALEQLQKLQKPDGGFAIWPGYQGSTPFLSPYAAQAIARAARAGLAVDPQLVSRTQAYLKAILADPAKNNACREQVCKSRVRLEALIALAEFGDKRNDFLADIYQQAPDFDLVTQVKLARYLSLLPDWQAEAKTLLNQLQEMIYQTGRTATVNLPDRWSWLSSPTTVQAQALRLFIAQRSSPEGLDRLLQGLLALRREGTWQTSYDNAEALTALVEYSQLQPTPPDFTATVQLAGKRLGSTRFQGYRKPNLELTVPTKDLPRGRHDLVLQKSGQGRLHYLVAYQYRLPGNQPGRFNGLRVVKEIRPANQEKVLRRVGMYAPDDALTVQVGQVFDVGVEITTDHPVDHVVITDPLPAGFEAVDTSFQTATPYFQIQNNNWEIGYQTIYRDRVVAYGDRLTPGVYQLHYLVRSVTPGTFLWPGAEAHLQYAPEEFGRSASSTLAVTTEGNRS